VTQPSPVRLYDSLRRDKVAFEPLQAGQVGIYVCGPTPYAPAHIGHAFSAISFDTIRRSLTFLGYQVRYVRNITDVEDKIIKRANELGEDPMALAGRFAEAYNRDMALFGVLAPDVEPKVSTHIQEIIDLIAKLVENGVAYASEGDVYYAVEKFPSYGKLSGMTVSQLLEGASDRELVEKTKRASVDFALWKAAKPGEPFWPSPWGNGRPGWHIECSAMTHAHLGESFDLHGGGKDLIFPHHENEIAQSQGAYGTSTFARHWMHNGFLNFGGIKMSKSLGNVFNCDEIAAVVGGEALRFFCVEHHYRSPVEFEVEPVRDEAGQDIGVRFRSLEAADRRLEDFYKTLHKLDGFIAQNGDGGDGDVLPEAGKLVAEARDALADDFNAPVVMSKLHEAKTIANRLLDLGKGIDKDKRKRTLARLGKDIRTVGTALGILANDPKVYLRDRRERLVRRTKLDVAKVEQLIESRKTARGDKDFKRADEIRGELVALGVELHDSPQGTDWSIQDLS
jgi:cysteinyl-tRNA synthetase